MLTREQDGLQEMVSTVLFVLQRLFIKDAGNSHITLDALKNDFPERQRVGHLGGLYQQDMWLNSMGLFLGSC